MKKIFRQIKNVFSFSCLYGGVYIADFRGKHWAMNVFMAMTFLVTIGYFAVVSEKEESPDSKKILKSYRDGHHFYRWLDQWLYAGLIFLLAAHAHWVLSFCWLLIAGCDLQLRDKALKAKGKK